MAMGECNTVMPDLECEENLIAAVQHIVKALGSKKNLTGDERKTLADLGTQLSTMASVGDCEGEAGSEIEKRLNAVREKIMFWEADQSMIWDSGPDEASDYLNAAEEARELAERLENMCPNKSEEEVQLLREAHDVLQMAMARLEEEFRHLLVLGRQTFEPEHMSFRSNEEDVTIDEGSVKSFEDDSVDYSFHRDNLSRASEEFTIDLIHPDVVDDLRSIANLMFIANYDQECSQAYTSVRKDALDECLFILEIEKLSIEDVLKMEWGSLNSKVKRWIRAMKVFVRVYLAGEKSLSDQIFGELSPENVVCFVEASKASMFQLLNFGEAVSIGRHQPEKFFRILDMYEVLSDLLPDIDELYPGETGSSVRIECHEVLKRLGDCVRATFVEFGKAIASNVSTTPFAGGGVHPLTKYVMNYLRTLTDYRDTLDLLLREQNDDTPISSSSSPDSNPEEVNADGDGDRDGDGDGDSSCSASPMAINFRSVASILESNLDDRSKLYKDASLQNFFLMNNIHYMAQKVKNSELRHVLGDKWTRKRNGRLQQHAMEYERATWSSILSLLRDEGLHNPGSNTISKTLLKERMRCFYIAFEEVYKTQTGWVISDATLREDLRISTSLKVTQAYWTFQGRHNNHISDKHFKYSADELQNFLMDLFEGHPKSLQNPNRKS